MWGSTVNPFKNQGFIGKRDCIEIKGLVDGPGWDFPILGCRGGIQDFHREETFRFGFPGLGNQDGFLPLLGPQLDQEHQVPSKVNCRNGKSWFSGLVDLGVELVQGLLVFYGPGFKFLPRAIAITFQQFQSFNGCPQGFLGLAGEHQYQAEEH